MATSDTIASSARADASTRSMGSLTWCSPLADTSVRSLALTTPEGRFAPTVPVPRGRENFYFAFRAKL